MDMKKLIYFFCIFCFTIFFNGCYSQLRVVEVARVVDRSSDEDNIDGNMEAEYEDNITLSYYDYNVAYWYDNNFLAPRFFGGVVAIYGWDYLWRDNSYHHSPYSYYEPWYNNYHYCSSFYYYSCGYHNAGFYGDGYGVNHYRYGYHQRPYYGYGYYNRHNYYNRGWEYQTKGYNHYPRAANNGNNDNKPKVIGRRAYQSGYTRGTVSSYSRSNRTEKNRENTNSSLNNNRSRTVSRGGESDTPNNNYKTIRKGSPYSRPLIKEKNPSPKTTQQKTLSNRSRSSTSNPPKYMKEKGTSKTSTINRGRSVKGNQVQQTKQSKPRNKSNRGSRIRSSEKKSSSSTKKIKIKKRSSRSRDNSNYPL